MSFESASKLPVPHNTPADLEAARELAIEHPRLANNPRIKEMIEADFVLPDGREVDAGNYLAALLNFLDSNPTATDETLAQQVEEAMVVHSKATR